MSVRGVGKLRLLLRKKIAQKVTGEVKTAIKESAVEAEEVLRYFAPRKEGDLISSITHVVSQDGLSAKVAPGIRGATTVKKRSGSYFGTQRISQKTGVKLNFAAQTKFDRFQFMKAYWLEYGTKGRKNAEGKRVGAIRPYRFVDATYRSVAPKAIKRIDKAVDKALTRLART